MPNPSFEIYKSCPDGNGVGIDSVPPWKGTNQSTDYFNACGINGFGVPSNSAGFQQARTGQAYAGQFFLNVPGSNYREYLQTQLSSNLISGRCYLVQFYVNLASGNFKYSCNNIGAYLSINSFTNNSSSFGNNVAPFTPQILANNNPIVSDTSNWFEIGGLFMASGGEKYLSLGNFKTDSATDTISNNYGSYSAASYFIDDVSVIEISSPIWLHDTIINLGDSVFVGSNYGGLDCAWYNMNTQLIDTTPGFYVKPNTDTKYIAHHTFCGTTFIDTIEVRVNKNLAGLNKVSISNLITLYPVPSNDELVLSIPTLEIFKEFQTISIHNNLGVLIREEEINSNKIENNTLTINTEDLH